MPLPRRPRAPQKPRRASDESHAYNDTQLQRYATRRVSPRKRWTKDGKVRSENNRGQDSDGENQRPTEDVDEEGEEVIAIPPGLLSKGGRGLPVTRSRSNVVRPPEAPGNICLVPEDESEEKIYELRNVRKPSTRLSRYREECSRANPAYTPRYSGRRLSRQNHSVFDVLDSSEEEVDETTSPGKKRRSGGYRNLSSVLGPGDTHGSILLTSSDDDANECDSPVEEEDSDIDDDEFLLEHEISEEPIPPKKVRLSAAREGKLRVSTKVKQRKRRTVRQVKAGGISLRGYMQWRESGLEPQILRKQTQKAREETVIDDFFEDAETGASIQEACRVCGLVLSSLVMDKHTQAHRKYIWADAKGQLDAVVERSCDACRMVFKHPGLLYQHKASIHHIVPLVNCTECGEQFEHRYDLIAHLKTEHLGLGPNECCLCLQILASDKTYANHMVRMHNIFEPQDPQGREADLDSEKKTTAVEESGKRQPGPDAEAEDGPGQMMQNVNEEDVDEAAPIEKTDDEATNTQSRPEEIEDSPTRRVTRFRKDAQ